MKEIIDFTINDLEINPSNIVVLTDREFKNFEIIKIFEKYGCNYISFIPKNDKVKYYLEDEYKKEEKWKFDYVIDRNTIPKLVIAEDEIITNNERKKVYYTFLTNINFENQESYIKMYKKRWNIETQFRMLKDAVIKTNLTSIKVRLFLFMLKCVIHNL
ncbi:transposase [Methanocaldococcus sp. 28A]